jgi:RND family efflux transporter MFP subunit
MADPKRRHLAISIATRAVICVVLLGLALAIFQVMVMTRPVPSAAPPAAGANQLLVMRATPVPVRRSWAGYGAARPMDAADVPARVATTVVEVPIEIVRGAAVRTGQMLARLDESDFVREWEIAQQNIADIDAQLARLEVEEKSWAQRVRLAEEDSRLARADFERIRAAAEGGAAKERELDRARQAVLAAERVESTTREEFDKVPSRRAGLQALRMGQESSRDLARQNVDRCTVTSPIDGVLESVDVDQGENVQPGERIARVVSLKRIEVNIQLPAAARAQVAPGALVHLESEAAGPSGDRETWSGTIARISPVDEPETRTFSVFVELAQSDDTGPILSPGRFVRGVVTAPGELPRTVIPRRALDNERIFTVEQGRIASRSVQVDYHLETEIPALGLPDRQWVVLRNDLPDDVLVVVNAARSMSIGAPAEPVFATDATGDDSVAEAGR